MATIRAFVEIASLANNTIGAVSPFGVITTTEQTYTREVDKKRLGSNAYPDVNLLVLAARNDSGVNTTLDINIQAVMLQVSQWVASQYNAGSIPLQASITGFIAAINTQFSSLITSVSVGTLIPTGTSTNNMPDYISFNATTNGVTWAVKLWFSGNALATQFDLFELDVTPPIPLSNLTAFTGTQAQVASALAAQTIAAQYAAAAQLEGSDRPTDRRPYSLQWTDPAGGGGSLTTTWLLSGYGPQAFNDENVSAAIKNLLATNAPSVTNWQAIFPSLYSGSEFVIVPLWKATPPQYGGTDVGVYSGYSNIAALKNTVIQRSPATYSGSTSSFVTANLEVWPVQSRGLTLITMGNPSNPSPYTRLSTLYPDYLNVSSGTTDYGRMTNNTILFLNQLTAAIEIARTLTPTSAVPSGYTTVQSGGRIYLAFQFNSYRFLVLTLFSYDNLV